MSSPTSDRSKLVVGTAPDSWGVWFAKDDHQVGWKQYLDEVALAGYVWTELGPQGFLPQDPAQLRDELASRGLQVSGGTVFAGLHKGADALTEAIAAFGQEARLLSEVGAKYLVHLPEQYTDMHTGAATASGDLDREQWKNLVTGTNELGRVIFEEHGVQLVFHPHADTHVDTQDRILQFLADTDPRYVNLCLDTGHVAYCDGDNIEIIRQAPERITYVHLKFVDPTVRQRVRDENLSLAEAVPLGVMVEPPVRGTGRPAAAGRADRTRPGGVHHPGAGPVPGRTDHPAGHPGPRRRLPHRLRPRPHPPLALPALILGSAELAAVAVQRRRPAPTCTSPTATTLHAGTNPQGNSLERSQPAEGPIRGTAPGSANRSSPTRTVQHGPGSAASPLQRKPMSPQPLIVITIHGGPRDGERFVAPINGLHEESVISYLDGARYTLSRDPGSGRWRATPANRGR